MKINKLWQKVSVTMSNWTFSRLPEKRTETYTQPARVNKLVDIHHTLINSYFLGSYSKIGHYKKTWEN